MIAGLYAVYHRPHRLRQIAERVHRLSVTLASGLKDIGFNLVSDTYFDTLSVETDDASKFIAAAAAEGINLREMENNIVAIAVDETTSRFDVQTLWRVFGQTKTDELDFDLVENSVACMIPDKLLRRGPILTHPFLINITLKLRCCDTCIVFNVRTLHSIKR